MCPQQILTQCIKFLHLKIFIPKYSSILHLHKHQFTITSNSFLIYLSLHKEFYKKFQVSGLGLGLG